ncbi:hypothetical protein FQA47_013020 [Oryzias melastigma]|uniref:Uncharacterized protein n=1 Tax=Oryzias melastigma TaxID=30732 RepID=A0A834L1D6_ORYME|nr:hypothetical protein FQA47_013020 [Oryzias melastigma]
MSGLDLNAATAFSLVISTTLSLQEHKKKRKKKGVCGAPTAHSPLFKEKRGGSKRHVSAQSDRSLALMVTVLLHRDRWDLSCCAEGCFSGSFWGLESTYHTIPPYRLFKRVLRVKPLTPWPPLLQCCCLK